MGPLECYQTIPAPECLAAVATKLSDQATIGSGAVQPRCRLRPLGIQKMRREDSIVSLFCLIPNQNCHTF